MNANRTPLCAALAALTLTLIWAGSAPAQSNATDTTFFPMHQGNRWVYALSDQWISSPIQYRSFEIKGEVSSIGDSLVSTYFPMSHSFIAPHFDQEWMLGDSVLVEFNLLRNAVYGTADGNYGMVLLADFGEEVGYRWQLWESPYPIFREIVARDTVGDAFRIRIWQYMAWPNGTVDYLSMRSWDLQKAVGIVVSSVCSDCHASNLVAYRVNGEVFGDITVSDGGDRADVPEGFRLEAAYPNPFNPETTLRFALDRSGDVALEVYDMLGRRVLAQDLGALQAGEHRYTLDLSGRPSGTYLVRMTAGGQMRTTRVTLLK